MSDLIDPKFLYQLLDRLRNDCKYYLGNGNRCAKYLWAGDPKSQIELMRYVYSKLTVKPEWLTLEDIDNLEKEML